MGVLTQARSWATKAAMVGYYRAQHLVGKVDPNLAVYASFWGKGFSCNPRAIYEKAREIAPHIKGVWVMAADAPNPFPADVDVVVEGSADCYRALARAGFLVNNVNFGRYYRKRSGSVFIQTHHGTPLKAMGIEIQRADSDAVRKEEAELLQRCRAWDFSLSSNAHSTAVWRRAYPVDCETLEYGYPRNDRLVRADPADVRAQRQSLDLADDETVVLYAPTYRDSGTTDPFLDPVAVAEALGPGYRLLVRAHHLQSGVAVDASPTARVLDVSDHPLIEDLYLAADVLVTDYSSTMFDYAVLDRPIAIHAADWDEYRRERGVNFDLLAEPPGFVARSAGELVDGLLSGAVSDLRARRAARQFRRRFCELDDGHAAERVVRRVMLGERGGTVGA